MEFIRALILATGWPILITGSTYLIMVAVRFNRDVGKTVLGKLVLAMVIGWFVSMYSLGITATAYMFADVRSGVTVVLPIFFVWFITMLAITWAVLRWSKEAVTLSAFYRGLEDLVKKRTAELEISYRTQLENEKEIRQLRERFVFIAAHELRTPVTAIEWGLATMLEDRDFTRSLPEDYLRLLKDLRAKNNNLLALVSDLLNVARLQGGGSGFEPEPVAIYDIAAEVKEDVEKIRAENDILLEWDGFSKDLPPLRAHPVYLREILMNLVVNAIRYNKRGGWVKVEVEKRPKELIVRVKDSGLGISPEEMKGLFQEFYRVKSSETRGIEGTGLGLFITKKLLERMGGKIRVMSKKGEGSVFSFSLPIAAAPN